jgi:DNA-binding NarL/FixJ family response regulator
VPSLPTERPKPKPVVFLIDDSEIVREVVEMTLEEHGYETVGFESPFELVPALASRTPALILVDVSMPALRGDKIVEMLRRAHKLACPIVLFSDRDEGELSKRALSCGASGFICKRDIGDALAARVAHFIAMGPARVR